MYNAFETQNPFGKIQKPLSCSLVMLILSTRVCLSIMALCLKTYNTHIALTKKSYFTEKKVYLLSLSLSG